MKLSIPRNWIVKGLRYHLLIRNPNRLHLPINLLLHHFSPEVNLVGDIKPLNLERTLFPKEIVQLFHLIAIRNFLVKHSTLVLYSITPCRQPKSRH